MKRLLALLIGLMLTWLTAPAMAGAAPSAIEGVHGYNYDSPANKAFEGTPASKRGPPFSGSANITYDYDDTGLLLQGDMVEGTTSAPGKVRNGDLSAFERLQVAAKTGRAVEGSLSPTLKAGDRSFIYGDRVLSRAKEAGDSYHNFPSSFDSEVLTRGARNEISEGYVQYTLRGSVNGVEGVYEIGARPSGLADAEVITHRFFRPGG